MKKLLSFKIKPAYFAIAIILFLELVFHMVIFNKPTFLSIIYIVLSSFIVGTLITSISLVFSCTINKIIHSLLLLIISLLFITQFIFYKFYNITLSIYSLFRGGMQVSEFYDTIFAVMLNNWIIIFLFILPVLLLMIFYKKENYQKDTTHSIILLIVSILFYLLFIFALESDKSGLYSAKNLYYKENAMIFSVQKMGVLTSMEVDFARYLFGFSKTSSVLSEIDTIKEIEVETKYNVLEIDFDSLINSETNQTIKEMHSYFSSVMPTKQNEYTGMFEGKNLIYIVAEAFSPIAIDKDVTPNLYKMYSEGFQFNNFYTPLFYVSTSDGEYTTLLSTLPKDGVWNMSKSSKNYLPFAYGNIFKDLGYKTLAYHNGWSTYYDRNLSHPNMGYEKFVACGRGLETKINCKLWPQSDLEMINVTTNDYIFEEKFMTYYMTISTHLNYTFDGNNMADKNKDLVKDLPYSSKVKGYMATVIELDQAIGLLIKSLEEKGIIDNTVIALSADHYPYGLKASEINEKGNYIEDEKFDIHKNSFLIWNSAIKEPIIINKTASSLDTLPTILNLFNISYDSRLLIGKDILSDSDGLVIFSDRSWITDEGKYDAIKKKFTSFTSETISEEYINNINNIIYNKYNMSKLILENDYYKYVIK